MHRFFIKLRNTQEAGRPLVLYYKISDHAMGQYWQDCIIKNFLGDDNNTNSHPIEKTYCFQGWQTDWNQNSYPRNINILCEQMNDAIAIINSDLDGYPTINLHFDLASIQGPGYRELMNEIHHHFEVLIGQVWNPSKWFGLANNRTQWAIVQLNNLCHEIEGNVVSITDESTRRGGIFLSFNGVRIDDQTDNPKHRYELDDSHYGCWEERSKEWGMITSYYSQLGKTHVEVFMDGDEHIDKDNISAPRYMTGECILNFVHIAPGTGHVGPNQRFDTWLAQNGWDPQDPKLAKGTCVIGRLDTSMYPQYNNDWQLIDAEIRNCDDVYEVGFVDENLNTVISKVYDFTWQEVHNAVLAKIKL